MKLTGTPHAYCVPPYTIAALLVVLALLVCVLAYIGPIIVIKCASTEQRLGSLDNAILLQILTRLRFQILGGKFFASPIRVSLRSVSKDFIAYLTPVGLTDWAWTVYTVDE